MPENGQGSQQPQVEQPQAQQPQAQQPQQPQQPYGQPQQPYYQQPQQPYYQQPVQPVVQPIYVATRRPATEGEKNGLFNVAGSWMMLVLCIVGTINFIMTFIDAVTSFNIFSMLMSILPLLMVIGMWLAFISAKQKKLNPTAPKLIKVPFTVNYVLTMIGYVLADIVAVILLIVGISVTMAFAEEGATPDFTVMLIGLAVLVVVIVMQSFFVKYYKSLMNCLKNSISINEGYGAGEPSGTFAATLMFIMAGLNFLPSLAMGIIGLSSGALLSTITAALGDSMGEIATMLQPIFDMIAAGGVMTLITGIITLAYECLGGVMILQFVKGTKDGGLMQ